MKRRLNSTQRNYIIIGLCAILVIMGVGYAAFQSQLKISGTSNIGSNFLVKITNIEVSNIVGGAADKEEVTTHTDTTATFGTTLQSPGDSITYDITIENQGTIDAILKTITKTDTSNSAILFTTSGVNEGDPLNEGELATMQVTVTYNPAVTSQPEDLDSTLKVDLDYEQAGGSVGPGPGGETTTIGGQDVPVVDSGDGLYKDKYEDGRYIYKGSNPNNYIIFNNETWRIISKEVDGAFKIVRNEVLDERVYFDEPGHRTDGDGVDSSSGNYCLNSSMSGCNAWASTANMIGNPSEFSNGSASGIVTDDSSIKKYLNETYLPTIVYNEELIVNYDFQIGPVDYENNDLISQITSEKSFKWNGKIGLVSVSDYIKANSNEELCSTFQLANQNLNCMDTNWMHITSGSWASINPRGKEDTALLLIFDVFVNTDTSFSVGSGYANSQVNVRPSVYLDSNIKLDGKGTLDDPFTIV